MPRFRLLPWMRRSSAREWLGALGLIGLLMQAPIPAGFMPEGAGAAFLKICTGVIGGSGDTARDRGGHDPSLICPFALAAADGAAPALPSPAGNLPGNAGLVTLSFTSSLAGALVGPTRAQTPRGPPTRHS